MSLVTWTLGGNANFAPLSQVLSRGERKINGDIKPFTLAESDFADAQFFKEDAVLKETTPAAISSTGKGSVKNAKKTSVPPKESGDGNIKLEQ